MHQNIHDNTVNLAEYVDDSPVVKGQTAYYIFKRCFDFTLAFTVLVIFSPLFLLIAILILIDSRGSVFFIQQRVGARWLKVGSSIYWRQVVFPCFKFRTMVDKADQSLHKDYIRAFIQNDFEGMKACQNEDTHVCKLIHDPRITRIGKCLRKTSLDELPQFWNVLIGDMSVVGPRPAIPYELEYYKPWHFKRYQALPGITGLWQVSSRSSADFDDMVKLDITYIENQSFWLDLKIILKTPLAVFSCRGAL
jgi:lipopolysaccharide/colanic/teichoic acid biosynthesis glycosyltransferase